MNDNFIDKYFVYKMSEIVNVLKTFWEPTVICLVRPAV